MTLQEILEQHAEGSIITINELLQQQGELPKDDELVFHERLGLDFASPYTLSWLLLEDRAGLGDNELSEAGEGYWVTQYEDEDEEESIRQIFWDLRYENFPRLEPISWRRFLGDAWPPSPISYRNNSTRFDEYLRQIKQWVDEVKRDFGHNEHNKGYKMHFLPPFRDARDWPELKDIPSYTIPDDLSAPKEDMDFYLIPLWNEC